jgi:N-acyl-phosphatidylethanolamine-hydrolysing phospholipase D
MSSPTPRRTPLGRFRNPWPGVQSRGPGDVLVWMVQRLVTGIPRDPPAATLPRMEARLGDPPDGGVAATWLGHSTVLLRTGGKVILTDPVWGQRVSPIPFAGPARWVPPQLALGQLPPLDLIVLSHNHYDHLDRWTIQRLGRLQPEVEWAVPLGLGQLARQCGARRVTEFDWWDERDFSGIRVGAAPARHFSARGFHDRFASLWCGWTVTVGERRIYFAGDTAYHPDFAEVARRFGPFDLSLIPIGAYEPRWFMRAVHVNPEEAVQISQDLRTAHANHAGRRVVLGIHWGTYKLTDEPMDEPPVRARAAWRAAGLPEEDLWILAQGETAVVPATPRSGGSEPASS